MKARRNTCVDIAPQKDQAKKYRHFNSFYVYIMQAIFHQLQNSDVFC